MLLSLAVRARRGKVETGSEGMIGEIGSAVTELAPAGKVLFTESIGMRSRWARGRRRGDSGDAIERLRLT